jgi:hypothetical protein
VRTGLSLAAVGAIVLVASPAFAGPPYTTDDPAPTDTLKLGTEIGHRSADARDGRAFSG